MKVAAEAAGSSQNRLALADYYVATNRLAEAAPILQGLSTDPSVGTAARLRQAAIDQHQGHAAAAEKTIDDILTKEPRNVQVLLAKAQLLLARHSLDEALKCVDQAVAADPSSASAQFARGKILLARHQPDDAKTAFNETLKLNPRAAAAQVELARLHLQAGAPDTSIALASGALKTDPTSGDARLVLARALMARGDLNQAETLLRELLTAAPRSAVVHAQMGLLQGARGNRSAAAAEFDAALAINPLQLEAVAGQVTLDLARHDATRARQRVDALVVSAPTNTGLLTLAARVHLLTDDAPGAEALLLKAIASDSTSLAAYSLLGQLYVRGNRLDEAKAQFATLAQRQSKPVSALTMIGIIDQMRGRTDDAQRTFEQVLQVDSRAAVAANNLAWIYCENGGNLDVALQLAQTAKGSLPEQAEVDDTLGWIYYRKELVPLAITALQRSVDHDPKNPLSQYHLGLAYYKLGDKARARVCAAGRASTATQLRGIGGGDSDHRFVVGTNSLYPREVDSMDARRTVLAVALAVSALAVREASASPITWQAAGVINTVSDGHGVLGPISPGTAWALSVTFESDTPGTAVSCGGPHLSVRRGHQEHQLPNRGFAYTNGGGDIFTNYALPDWGVRARRLTARAWSNSRWLRGWTGSAGPRISITSWASSWLRIAIPLLTTAASHSLRASRRCKARSPDWSGMGCFGWSSSRPPSTPRSRPFPSRERFCSSASARPGWVVARAVADRPKEPVRGR